MEVKITFDTEKESIEDLNRLIASLQDLVARKEKAATLGNPLTSGSVARQTHQQSHQQPASTSSQTAGGGRVIPYQDISTLMEKVFSGKK
jgi:hypothetical protein